MNEQNGYSRCITSATLNRMGETLRLLPNYNTVTLVRVPLFHPRNQQWATHFNWSQDGSEIIGRTAIGRATIAALKMNHLEIVEARRRWASVGWHPP